MNLCILANRENKPSETFIRSHIERLDANITVLYARDYPYYTGVSLHSLRKPGEAIKDLAKLFLYPVNLLQKKLFKRFLRKNEIEVILAEYGLTGVKIMDIAESENIPLVVHFHGFEAYDKYELARVENKYERMFEVAHKTIAVSKEMTERLMNMGASEEGLEYIPYGVDTEMFHGSTPDEAPQKFVSVGRFVPKKGPKVTIKAFKKVVDGRPEATLTMVGQGPLLEEAKRLAKSLNIRDSITFTGVLSHESVAELLRSARCFVLHSNQPASGDSEGTPLAILEAEASGLPVVSTKHAGIQDVVIEGETGYLVEERDVEAYADKMIELAEDPKLAAELGQNAQKRVQKHFSMDRYISSLQTIIEEAQRIQSNS